MTVDPTLVISIDDTGVAGAPGDLTFSARLSDTPALGITRFREVASEPQITRVGDAGNIHGSGVVTEWAYQEGNIAFSFVTNAASETASRALLASVRAFLGRLRYSVTITAAGATAETWVCYPGSLTPDAERSRTDLAHSNPVWNVVIPCHPIRS